MSAEQPPSDPYDAVIADLESKITQLQQAVSALRAIKSGAAAVAGGATVTANAEAARPSDGPGAFLGLSIPEAAKKLLSSRRAPMRNPDIWAALKAGGMHLNSAEPVNTIGSVLTRRFTDVGDIVRVGRGTWGLKEWYPNRSFKSEKGGEETKAPEKSEK